MNYNDLLNKPMVNGKELMGNISILGLPTVTTSDVGKVAIVGENGTWTTGTVSGGGGGFNSNSVTRNISTATITKTEEE